MLKQVQRYEFSFRNMQFLFNFAPEIKYFYYIRIKKTEYGHPT